MARARFGPGPQFPAGRSRIAWLGWASTLALASVLVGCRPEAAPAPAPAPAPPAAARAEWTSEQLAEIEKKFGPTESSPTGLRWIVRQPGAADGPPPRGATVLVHYTGRLLDDRVFDSTEWRRQPFAFRVGARQVIDGWDEAFSAMHKGEKRTLIIPHWLAYGEKGRVGVIPPRATLVFDVELLDWRTTDRLPGS